MDPVPGIHHLSAHDIVVTNCEIYRPGDQLVEELWTTCKKTGSIPFHGFTRESVKDVSLKRFFSSITLNYIFVKIQDLMDVFLVDTRNENGICAHDKTSGVFVTRDREDGERRFILVTHFQVYAKTTCTPTKYRITVALKIHESPSPWVVACRVDTEIVEGSDNITE